MGFAFSNLILESVIREGFEACRRDPSIFDDVFENLKNLGVISSKYGKKEINKIKKFFKDNEVSVVFNFAQVPVSVPCVSIQLMDDQEDPKFAHLDDFEENTIKQITDPGELNELVVVTNFEPEQYDPNSGTVYCYDSTDLSNINTGLLFQDANGNTFQIIGGINNASGAKQFCVARQSEVDIDGECLIKSPINYEVHETRGNIENEKLLLGVHTKNALMTIYLWTLVKYFLLSRKKRVIELGLDKMQYSGSDFTRNMDYKEPIYDRFLTVWGITQNNWLSDKITPIDNINVGVLIPKDKYSNSEIAETMNDPNADNQTVQVGDEEQED